MESMQAPGTKMVRSKDIAALMTCPICIKILRNATTISECLHTFCKKCISKMIVEEDLKNCPVCKTDLGCSPLEKLRPDHNMQSLVEKIFSSFKKRVKEPEASESKAEQQPKIGTKENEEQSEMPSIPMPSRRKERSLSSLVTDAKVPNEPLIITGRRKSAKRQSPNFVYNEDPIGKVDVCPESESFPMALRKVVRSKKPLSSSTTQSSKQSVLPNKGKRQSEHLDGKTNLWKPLVEAADTIKASKPCSRGIVIKTPTSPTVHQDKANVPKGKGKGKVVCMNVYSSSTEDDADDDYEEEEHRATLVPTVPVKLKRTPRGKQNGEETSSQGVQLISPQEVIEAVNKCEKGALTSIWLSLVASPNQDGSLSLPQIPSRYLRIKDVRVPILFVKKYLARKLELESEDEVEIELHGRRLPPSLQLYILNEMWLRITSSAERITTSVGSSAKDFVMVLTYHRK